MDERKEIERIMQDIDSLYKRIEFLKVLLRKYIL